MQSSTSTSASTSASASAMQLPKPSLPRIPLPVHRPKAPARPKGVSKFSKSRPHPSKNLEHLSPGNLHWLLLWFRFYILDNELNDIEIDSTCDNIRQLLNNINEMRTSIKQDRFEKLSEKLDEKARLTGTACPICNKTNIQIQKPEILDNMCKCIARCHMECLMKSQRYIQLNVSDVSPFKDNNFVLLCIRCPICTEIYRIPLPTSSKSIEKETTFNQ